MNTVIEVVLIVLGVLVSLFLLVLLVFYCRQDRFFYQPNRGASNPLQNERIPDDGAVVFEDKARGISITFKSV